MSNPTFTYQASEEFHREEEHIVRIHLPGRVESWHLRNAVDLMKGTYHAQGYKSSWGGAHGKFLVIAPDYDNFQPLLEDLRQAGLIDESTALNELQYYDCEFGYRNWSRYANDYYPLSRSGLHVLGRRKEPQRYVSEVMPIGGNW